MVSEKSDKKRIKTLKVLVILLLVVIIFHSIYFSILYEEREQPLLLLIDITFAGNIDDESETLFHYYIYNFGDVEAKGVKVTCDISENDIINKKETFDIGNIASNSWEYQESILEYYLDYSKISEEGYCYLEYDENYINLLDKVNE